MCRIPVTDDGLPVCDSFQKHLYRCVYNELKTVCSQPAAEYFAVVSLKILQPHCRYGNYELVIR